MVPLWSFLDNVEHFWTIFGAFLSHFAHFWTMLDNVEHFGTIFGAFLSHFDHFGTMLRSFLEYIILGIYFSPAETQGVLPAKGPSTRKRHKFDLAGREAFGGGLWGRLGVRPGVQGMPKKGASRPTRKWQKPLQLRAGALAQ